MSDDSLIDDVREVAALLGRTEDRALTTGATTDELVGAIGDARCHLEATLLLRGEDVVWTGSGPEPTEPAAR